jgi:hypothetical protein
MLCPFVKVGATYKTPTGLHPDGQTDDSGTLNSFIQACSVGDVVYFPKGTYLCSSPLVAKDGVDIRGQGDSTWLKGAIRPACNMKFIRLKLGVDGQTFGWLEGTHVTHDLHVIQCTIAGAVQFTNELISFYDSRFDEFTFLRDESATVNHVALYTYGTAASRYYNLVWRRCTFEGASRMNWEMSCYASDPDHYFEYPWYGLDLIDCDFGPADGRGSPSAGDAWLLEGPYDGDFQCGYGRCPGAMSKMQE